MQVPSKKALMSALNFAVIPEENLDSVKNAINNRENFHGYCPEECFDFIIENARVLAKIGILEGAWLQSYVHKSHFADYDFETIREVFELCDRQRLIALKPFSSRMSNFRNDRAILYRGCAGPNHTFGMSWTPLLEKAIWYAARHADYYDLENLAVYVTIAPLDEIYCELDHYDDNDCIYFAKYAWKIDVPQSEFRLNRPR